MGKPTQVSPGCACLVLLVGALGIGWCTYVATEGGGGASPPAPTQAALVARFQGPDEPTAKDAYWSTPQTFLVGVLDDGSSRDGYARYVCEVLRENGMVTGYRVKVIDAAKLARENKRAVLGEARCGP